jgi:CBS domain containing-hemolysin-like protein
MQRSGAHLARVDASDGGLLGVVALEDVLEELVGEIRDEAGTREHEVVTAPTRHG